MLNEAGLKPCPFCGVPPFHEVQNGNNTPFGQVQFVWCEKCDACGPERYSEAEAIEAWNRRASVQGEPVAVKEVVGPVAWQWRWRWSDGRPCEWSSWRDGPVRADWMRDRQYLIEERGLYVLAKTGGA